MPRSTGWSVLAEKALELAALALAVRFMRPSRPQEGSMGEPVPPVQAGNEPEESKASQATSSSAYGETEPLEFLRESSDFETRFYRASDDQVEVLVAFFADGRIRVADAAEHRFAGMLTHEKGDLLDIRSKEWSRVFVRATPEGKTQLELRGGPYHMHVLTCEPLEK